MKVICAPDKFKGSLTAVQAAKAMARGVVRAAPRARVDLCPVADGGEGTCATLVAAMQGQERTSPVLDPLARPRAAAWGWLPRQGTAVIEMAAASGLQLLDPQERDPTRATTFGTGLLLRAALDAGARRIILGIGGSATCDAGCGAAQALGVRFAGVEPDPPIRGADLERIRDCDLAARDPRIRPGRIRVACDVTNPLYGPEGAACVYGPQKGATPAQVEQLDRGLRQLARVVADRLGRDDSRRPGAGAAGGLGFGMAAFLDAELAPGIGLVLETLGFAARLRGCDLCLTGEGRLDGQTASGKAVAGVAQAARQAGVPALALVGSTGPGFEAALAAGLSGYHEIGRGLAAGESMRRAAELLEEAAARAVGEWRGGG